MAEARESPDDKGLPKIGSYELLQPLGTGGMSSVFRARHSETGVEIALKVLPRSLAKNPIVLQRFLREARSAEALEHPSVVAIYDHGVDQGRYYLVLEYVAGGDLHDRVRAVGPLAPAEAVAIIQSVTEGLQFAAGRGVIHRDIKPANLLLTNEGRVKIADLGLALQVDEEDERVTREGTTVGTVDYMAPEQARDSRATSLKSDMYSLGCTFYFLLTGQPPFPGGDVADKLNRHINAVRPDPRDIRPEIPENISVVLKRMMARRPEARYTDYDDLLYALDNLGHSRPPALPDVADAPLFDLMGEPPEKQDDDAAASDPGFIPLAPADGLRTFGADTPDVGPPAMADLADLDDFEEPAVRAELPLVRGPVLPAPVDSDDLVPSPVTPVSTAGRGMSQTEKSWLTTCILAGVGLVLLVITVDQVFLAASPSRPGDADSGSRGNPVIAAEDVTPIPRRGDGVVGVAVPRPDSGVRARPNAERPQPGFVRRPWVEPADPAPMVSTAPLYPPAREAEFLPAWAKSPPAGEPAGRTLVVRRLADESDPNQKTTLAAALEAPGEVIEIADRGPFFEESLGWSSGSRVIRSAPRRRAVISLGRHRPDAGDESHAYADLGNRSLILEGIDLVVDVSLVTPARNCLFLCRGGSLTLRDCTLTVVNRAASAFTVIRSAPAATPSRIWLDRTFVRGVYSNLAELQGGPGELAVVGSLVLNGQGTGLSFSRPAPATAADAWRVFVVRSVFLTWGSAFERLDLSPGVKAVPIAVRSLGSTFARFDDARPGSFFRATAAGFAPADLLDWQGDDNQFDGWTDVVSAGNARTTLIAGLAAARAVWKDTDPSSAESATPWPPLPPSPERVLPRQMGAHSPRRLATVAGVPSPTPWLVDLTTDPMPFPPDAAALLGTVRASDTAARSGTPAATSAMPLKVGPEDPSGMFRSGQTAGFGSSSPTRQTGPTTGSPDLKALAAKVQGVRELEFKTEAAPWNGDVGRFLAESIVPTDRLVRVVVSGNGRHNWTPARVPEGVSVEIVVVPDAGGRRPSWNASGATSAEALVDVHAGSLSLYGVMVERDGTAGLGHLFRVHEGHLMVRTCHLSAPGGVEDGGGNLLAFEAPGTRPPDPLLAPWPFAAAAVRPTCLVADSVLSTGGNAVDCEVGRGLLVVSQCAVIAGKSAFRLQPGAVARASFQADLVLDHCSLASEHGFISPVNWPGSEPGPDRPWLVSTIDCAFLGQYDRPGSDGESALLSAGVDALAQGVIFWQSTGDAYDVPRLLARPNAPATAPRRFDARRDWTRLWGQRHVHNVSGPKLPTGASSLKLFGRLSPGRVQPADLAIAEYPTGRKPGELGVDFGRLGIATPRGPSGR